MDETFTKPCYFDSFAKDEDGCINYSDFVAAIEDCEVMESVCVVLNSVVSGVTTKENTAMDKNESLPEDAVVLADATMTPPPVLGAVTATTTASVAVQDSAIADIKALIPADGHVSGATVAMAVVGLAGSGAVIKLVKSFMDSRQEQEMKRLEIEERKAESTDEQHATCSVERAALEAKVAALTSTLETITEKMNGMFDSLESADSKIEELKSRLHSAEYMKEEAKPKKPVKKPKRKV